MTEGRAPSLRERQKRRTADALVAAAERRFASVGYLETTVEQIAEDAEVSVSSLYNAFGGKWGLYLAVVEGAVEANRRYMDQAWDPALSALEQVLAAADAYLLFHLDHPGFFQMVALPHAGSRPTDDTAEVQERIAARVEAEVGRLEDAIRRGVAAGELLEVDPGLTAKFLWGAWNGVIALGARPDRLRATEDEIARILEAGRRLVLEGLAPAAARVESGRLSARVAFPQARRPEDA